MKISSISKPITMTMMCKMWEMGMVDIDKNITEYIKYWPDKFYAGKKVRFCDPDDVNLKHVTYTCIYICILPVCN